MKYIALAGAAMFALGAPALAGDLPSGTVGATPTGLAGPRAPESTSAATTPPAAALATPASDVAPDPASSAAPLTAEETQAMFEAVPAGDPAYGELRRLRRDGYLPTYAASAIDGRPLTHYEVAVMTQRAATRIRVALTEVDAAQNVKQGDLDDIRQLLGQYGKDINELRTQIAALSDKLDKTNKRVDENTATLARQKFGLQYFLRAPGIFSDHVTAYNGNSTFTTPAGVTGVVPGVTYKANALLPGGTPLTTGNNPGQIGQNALVAGDSGHGTGYQILRMYFSGIVDPDTSYLIRLENRYYFDNINGLSATTPAFCTAATSCPVSTDYPNNATLRLNIAAIKYQFPKTNGLSVTGGRFLETEGPRAYGSEGSLGLLFEDYFNGVELGYTAPRLHAVIGYGFGDSSLANTGFSNLTTGQSIFGTANYSVSKTVTAGASYLANLNYYGQIYYNQNAALLDANGFPIRDLNGNAITGAYQSGNANNSAAISAFASYRPNAKTAISLEGLHRFGNNPFTGQQWQDADAFYLLGQYGALLPKRYSSYGELGLIEAGFNSTLPQSKVSGTPDYQQFYVPNPNGYRIFQLGVHHWFSDAARIGLEYQNYSLIPNFLLPASSASCPGCVITKDNKNALLLETYLNF